MLTRWGRALDRDRPLPEYPRPQLVREAWVNLNGVWEHAFTDSPDRPASYDGPIVVPFSPEAELSGVGRQLQPDEWLWYRRSFTPPSTTGRVLLHFGAVDQTCTVWVNDAEVGSHTGGYLPFTLDVTDHLRGDDVLEVRVRDLSETGVHARGKQRLDRKEIWYTAQSGIWQTVWLEAVPASYVERLVLTPHLETDELEVTVVAAGVPVSTPAHVVVGEDEVDVPAGVPVRIALSDVRPWSPEHPHLYDVEVTLADDRVTSYAAMRSFGVGPDEHGHTRFLLNGEPVTHVGVLDQGYWPDGLLTPPSDEAMVHDIETMRSLGFTMLRKHAKVEPLRWYAHCDRLGMLVWQDVVNGGGRYRALTTRRPARFPVWIPDRLHRLYDRGDAEGREEFRREVRATVELLRNVVSLAVWTPFNEAWGQFDANAIARRIADVDPTRLVNHTSGWVDQGGGDVRSFHRYVRPFRMPSPRRLGRRDARVVALSEYGGFSLRVEGHDWSPREFGYRHFEDSAALADGFADLHEPLADAVRRGLGATVYTQLSDVEDELNGLLTYDREVLKIDADVIRQVTATLHP
ncbi:glycoside hydrolase family 2 protein [Marmoricola sp. URHB0036]|uniref:glycoside hydrolase family 2 protein n=1 Tax=Marmoricola sp. URHB0036 TaxID=1298863 RepID=UPI000402B8AA|nr:glycoside hydrolase family 2 [Marmoricola sp. URHB0036]